MNNKPNYYSILTPEIRYDKTLSNAMKIMYSEITALCNKEGYCWATNQYFADLYEVSKKTISNWINSLIKRGHLTSKIIYRKGTKQVEARHLYMTVATYGKIEGEVSIKKDIPYGKNEGYPPPKNVKDNITRLNNKTNTKFDKRKEVSQQKQNEIKEIWNSNITGNIPKIKLLTKSRMSNYNKRVKEGLDLLELINVIVESDFLQGDNKNNWIVTFDWIIANEKNWIKIIEGNYKNAKFEKVTPKPEWARHFPKHTK